MMNGLVFFRVLSFPVIRDSDAQLMWLREIWINGQLHDVKVADN